MSLMSFFKSYRKALFLLPVVLSEVRMYWHDVAGIPMGFTFGSWRKFGRSSFYVEDDVAGYDRIRM